MKIKVEQVNRYRLTIGGHQLDGEFELESEWQGMLKFSLGTDQLIVSKPDTFGEFFATLFASSTGSAEVEMNVIKASPMLLAEIKEHQHEQTV